jgi:alkylhydroperoxidase family enzyme
MPPSRAAGNDDKNDNHPENHNMRSFFARRILRVTSKRYGYDTSYLDHLLTESPAAFFKFAAVAKAAAHREVVPVDARFAAKITGAVAEDCGPCVQLTIDMALEAGMPKDQVEAVVRRDTGAMNASTRLGFQFANAVASHAADADQYRDAVRAQWGEKGVIDLAMALQIGRLFPMLKAALGYAKECRRVTVDGYRVDVIKQAA